MPTVSRGLPQRPHLDVPKRQARDLLNEWRANNAQAMDRIRGRHPMFGSAGNSEIVSATFRLSDAQLVIAREYGFSTWAELKQRITSNPLAWALDAAIRCDEIATVSQVLKANPHLLHIPVCSGNWGPPMSHAANLGRLEIMKTIDALGARDHQHALDRALLQGRIECARWLIARGTKLMPGAIMGSCETLSADGLRFLVEAGASFSNAEGDRLAPLAMVIQTYGRNPVRKQVILKMFADQGYTFPDTPMMAFHHGDVGRLKKHLRDDPQLIARRFTYREIYPPELGCPDDGLSGLHGTPLGGTTLLHLAIDFDEEEIFNLLLEHGADVNAPATVDKEGFGGHTPLFNAVVSLAYANGRQRDASMARKLLERGAAADIRVNLRKFLDWCEKPDWFVARNVTPAEWGRSFPEQSLLNKEALSLMEKR
jgi:hypothetical protein